MKRVVPAVLLAVALLGVPWVPGTGSAGTVAAAGATDVGSTSAFHALAPDRVLDTRLGIGALGPAAAERTITLTIPGIPAGVTAIAANLTATGTTGAGWVAAWASGPRPPTSSLNLVRAGQTIANLVTIPVDDGTISLYPSVETHLILDVNGYYLPSGATTDGRFAATAAMRVLDTRGNAPFGTGDSRTVDLRPFGVPADATAAVVNLTVAPGQPGFWTLWPSGERPNASNLNLDQPGQTIANQAQVALHDGTFQLYASGGGDAIVDLTGFFTGPSADSSGSGLFVPQTPTRILDTRGESQRPIPGDERAVASLVDAAALVTNLTLVDAEPGWVSAWSGDGTWPGVSSINASVATPTIANHAIVALAQSRFALKIDTAGDVLVDATGYFTNASNVATTPTTVSVAPPVLPTTTVTTTVTTAVTTTTQPSTTVATSHPSTTVASGFTIVAPADPATQGPPADWTPPTAAAPYAFFPLDVAAGSTMLPARVDPCTPVTYSIADSVPTAMRPEIVAVLDQFEGLTGLDFSPQAAGVAGTPRLSIEFAPLAAPTLGVTNTFYNATLRTGVYSKVTRSTISIDDDQPWTLGWGTTGMRTVVAHELGHALGLDHVDAQDHLMYFQVRDHHGPAAGEVNGLHYLYGTGCRASAPLTADGAARVTSAIPSAERVAVVVDRGA